MNTISHDMSLGNARQMLTEQSVGMSCHCLLKVCYQCSWPFLVVRFPVMQLASVTLRLCWFCLFTYPWLPSAVKTWAQRLDEKVNEIPRHISCTWVEAKLSFQAGSFQVNSPCPALYHRFLFRICCALREENIAEYMFLLHDFFLKFQNAFMGQFVRGWKGQTFYKKRRVCCVFKGASANLE